MSEIKSTITELRERASRSRSDAFLFDEAATTIEQLANSNNGIEAPSTGGVDPLNPYTPSEQSLQVGCTMGLETVDHLNKPGSYGAVPFDSVHDPAVIRFFYHMDKSTPDACAPKDMEQPFRAFTEQEGTSDWDWHEKVNYYRLKRLRERFPNTTIIVCTEIAEKPEGGLADFPNRNWKKEHWRDENQVGEWMNKFLNEAFNALGGDWIWQLSSEPWDIDWQWFHRTAIEELRDKKDSLWSPPVLMTPAFPIGQGGDNEFGTNKFWGRSFEKFMPADLRDAYTYVSFHNYPMTDDNEWTNNVTDWDNKLYKFLDALAQLGMQKCRKACTEYSFDMEDLNALRTSQYMSNKLYREGFSIATIYAYRTQGGAHFTNCYLQKRDGTHVDAYDLVTHAVPAASPA